MNNDMQTLQTETVLSLIREKLQTKETIVLAIDGTCGSGKTTLSDAIRREFPCNVFHTDDFYLPYPKRREGWRSIPTANMDLDRLKEEVLIPASKGEPVFYRPYDCPNDRFLFEKTFPVMPVTIMEGNYSYHPMLEEYYDLKVFLTLDREEQMRRIRIRDPKEYTDFESTWIPLAESYFEQYRIPEKSDIILQVSPSKQNTK